MLCEKNPKLMDLKFYINNIARCLGIVDLLSTRRQDHQCYDFIKHGTLFTSQLSIDCNYIHRNSILLFNSDKYTIPTKTQFLLMSTSTNTWFGSNDNITRLVPDFGGRFWPIFGQAKEEFFAPTVELFFDEKSQNQFYIRLCVQIFNVLFYFLFKLLWKYIYIFTPLKNYLPHTLRYMWT